MGFSSRLVLGITVALAPVVLVSVAATGCSSSESGTPSGGLPGSTSGGGPNAGGAATGGVASGGPSSAAGSSSAGSSSAGTSTIGSSNGGAATDAGVASTGGGTPGGSSTGGTPTTPPCKRGIAYNNENAADVPALKGAVSWWYDWSATPNAAATTALQNAGLEYVPMIWSGPPTRAIDVTGLIASIPSSAKYLLGFNEPDFGTQGNLTPAQAAADWPQLQQIAKARNLKLVAPGMNYCGGNCNETDPFVWLNAFFAACTGCQVDYVAFHWYNCDLPSLKTMLGRYEAYGKPVWLTEFACLQGSDTSLAAQKAYMQAAIPVLEADPNVFRYSWFIGRSSSPATNDVLGSPGSLTSLGTEYKGAAGTCH